MKRTKKIFLIFGIVIFSFLLILIITPIIFKGKILQFAKNQANENLNAKIEFADFKLSMFRSFPSLNLQITELSVVGVDDFENDTLTYMKYLSADLNFISVIKGDNIKIKSIVLNQPEIMIKILKNGKANYDIAIEDSTDIEEETDTISNETDEMLISLKKFEIIDGEFIYDDQEYKMKAILNKLNMELKGNFTEIITDIDFIIDIERFTYQEEGIALINQAHLRFDSKLNADLEKYIYTFEENLLSLNEFQLAFDGWLEMPEDDIIMDLSISSPKTEFRSLLSLVPAVYQSDFDGIETAGSLEFNGFAKGVLNDYQIPAFGINLIINDAFFQYPDLPAAVENINIDLNVTNPGNEDINDIKINKFHLEMAKNPIDISMLIKTTAEDVYLDGQIIASMDLNKVNEFYPLEDMTLSGILNTDVKLKGYLSSVENETFDNFDAQGFLKISNLNTEIQDVPPISLKEMNLQFAPEFAMLERFNANVGNSDLNLTGRIDNIFQYVFNDEILSAKFDFNSELLDLNEFLFSETTETSEEEAVIEEDTETSAFEIPGNIDFTLNSRISKIYYDKLIIESFVGDVIIRDSKLDLRELSMNLLSGSLLMTAIYDAVDYLNPQVDMNLYLTDIDVESTFQAFNTIQNLAPVLENCNGKISINFEMTTKLDSYLSPVMNSINGEGLLSTDNISITGNKLFTSLANLTKQEKYREPGIKDLEMYFEIENGNLEIKPTSFTLANTEASIEGTTNLDQSINYNLGITLPQTAAGNLVENLLNINKEIMIYATIGGTLTDPKIEKFNSSVTDEIEDQIIEGLSEEAKKLIEDAKKQAQKLIDDAEEQKAELVKTAENQAKTLKTTSQNEADELIEKAEEEGDALIAKAGNNPIAKKAAQKAADELLKVAQNKADKIITDANKEIDNIVKNAEKEGDKLIQAAEKEGDEIIKDAEEKAENL